MGRVELLMGRVELLWRPTFCVAVLMMLAACALQPRAMFGSANAQYRLGLKYLVTDPPEYEKAAYWLRRAAVQGDTQAQKQLGRFYALGWDGEPDLVRAYLWLQLASLLDPAADYERRTLAQLMSKEQIDRAHDLAARFQPGQAPDAELGPVERPDAKTTAKPTPPANPEPTKKDMDANGH